MPSTTTRAWLVDDGKVQLMLTANAERVRVTSGAPKDDIDTRTVLWTRSLDDGAHYDVVADTRHVHIIPHPGDGVPYVRLDVLTGEPTTPAHDDQLTVMNTFARAK